MSSVKFVVYWNSAGSDGETSLASAEGQPYNCVVPAFYTTKAEGSTELVYTGPMANSDGSGINSDTTQAIADLQGQGMTVLLSFGGAVGADGNPVDYSVFADDPSSLASQLSDQVVQYGFDGIDLDYEDTEALEGSGSYDGVTFITDLTNDLAAALPSSNNIITHAPQVPYLAYPGSVCDSTGNPYLQVLANCGSNISWLNMQFYNQGDCTQTADDVVQAYENIVNGWPETDGEDAFDGWPASQLLFGTPMASDDASSGYFEVDDLTADIIAPLQEEFSDFGGIMGWQLSDDPDGSWAQAVAVQLGLDDES